MKIYTRSGDAGKTGLLGGDRIAKNSLRIQAIGEVDELNAAIGVARAHGAGPDEELHRLQSWLFDLGGELAAPPGGKFDAAAIGPEAVRWLEEAIDQHMGALPPLKAFILPGGSPAAASLHLARTVCRRAERSALDLHEVEPVRENVRVFLNRLSDYLFALARSANAASNVNDVEWHRH
ncbi:MAG: cob(I)yrinic acid a,c-diamide adenosyltransferase [Alphaproteobacteria bacterium]|nr:MAG: cob(I)yrinic acid a,c-diamide adenosyltransferase [Alphaproteobacteria bacterium]